MINFKRVLEQKGKIDEVVDQLSGEIIELPKGTTITAIDPLIIALPKELFPSNARFDTVIDGDDDTEIGFQPGSNLVFIVLRSGKSLLIKHSSQSIFYAPQQDPGTIEESEREYDFSAKIPHRIIEGTMGNSIKRTLKVRVQWKKIE